jgi:NADH:ubiquinone oxidoreductase subunit 3 (subunit A)
MKWDGSEGIRPKKVIYIIIIISIVLISFSHILNKRVFYNDKISAVESGFDIIETEVNEEKPKWILKYYNIAILFLIFDLETVILFPYNVMTFDYFNYFIFLLFLYFISIGLYLEYRYLYLYDKLDLI